MGGLTMARSTGHFPERCTVYAYFQIWSETDKGVVSLLELAPKKTSWHGPRETVLPGASSLVVR